MMLVTVVTERLFSDRVVRDLRELGARGFTVSDVAGGDAPGTHAATFEGNVKIETVVSEEASEAMLRHLAEHYFAHHALIAYRHPVEVLRREKYD